MSDQPPRPAHDAGASSEHYSYRLYADPAMANQFDHRRFSGPIGTLVADEQARVMGEFVGDATGLRVLDVGTGTGRAAIAFAGAGALVTGVDASDEMLRVARRRAEAAGVAVRFDVADAHRLPFDDGTFDVCVSVRVLMHTPDWRTCLRELCRVARDRVVFDYPAFASVAALQSLARRAVAACGGQTEPYRVFRDSAIDAVLREAGYTVAGRHRQFVLPIAFHKAIGSRAVTLRLEGGCRRLGLVRLFGSPVTVVARRCAS